MLPMKPYKGPFSFVTSQLHSDVKTILPVYDKHDPKTWPYVTIAAVEKHGPYCGYPDLPAGIAYERPIMERYELTYSAADRKHIASVNGSFHERYPCNYDEHDTPKIQIGMSEPEYQRYMATVAKGTLADTNSSQLCRPRRTRKSDTKRNKSHDSGRYAEKKCSKTRHEAVRLQCDHFYHSNQRFSSKQYATKSEASGRYRRDATSHVKLEIELERQRQRAEAAEKEGLLHKRDNTRLLLRVKELERVIHGRDSCVLQ